MKILDKYILKQFVKNFAFGILCFLVIFILVDLFENLDKFIDKNLNLLLIFQYYLYFTPEILKLITPIGILMATLFTIGRFNNYSEMTAINSSGISLYRFSVPLLSVGLCVTLFSIFFNGWIVPVTNSRKFEIERKYLDKNKLPGIIQNLHIQDSENTIISIESYNENEQSGSNVSIQVFRKDNLSELQNRIDIRRMKWNEIKKEWILTDAEIRKFEAAGGTQTIFHKDTIGASAIPEIEKLYLSPAQIKKKQLKPDELLITDLKNFIDTMEESGQNVAKAKVDYYSKISFPFANIIILIFGISLVGSKKSGLAVQFGISVFITFVYLGFVKISQTFGYSGDLNPVLTAWMANIIFFSIALINVILSKIYWK